MTDRWNGHTFFLTYLDLILHLIFHIFFSVYVTWHLKSPLRVFLSPYLWGLIVQKGVDQRRGLSVWDILYFTVPSSNHVIYTGSDHLESRPISSCLFSDLSFCPWCPCPQVLSGETPPYCQFVSRPNLFPLCRIINRPPSRKFWLPCV